MKKKSLHKKYRVKRKKRIWHNSFLCSTAFFIFVFLAFAGYYLYHPFFQLEDIKVVGVIKKADASKAIERGMILQIPRFPSRSIFLVSSRKVEQGILQETIDTENIRVKKIFPSTIKITGEEKTPLAIWCSKREQKKCHYIDRDGVAYKEAEKSINFTFIRKGFSKGEKVISAQELEKLKGAVEKVDSMGIVIDYFILTDKENIEAVVKDGWSIHLSFEGIEQQLDNLKIIVQEKKTRIEEADLEYIRLRYNRVFIK